MTITAGDVTVDTLATLRVRFDQQDCPRCGGLGRLDQYAHVRGGRCVRCNGNKRELTRAGKAAESVSQALLDEILGVDVDSLARGDRVRLADGRWYKVAGVEHRPACVDYFDGAGRKLSGADGAFRTIETPAKVAITLGHADSGHVQVCASGTRVRRYSPEGMVEYILRMMAVPGATVVMKERETVWCEAHGGLSNPHFERGDCVYPHYTDQAMRARLNAVASRS